MKYTRKGVYTYVYNKVAEAFPDAYISGKYEPVPASFPSVFIHEISSATASENVSLSGVQDVRRSTFEVQIRSNNQNDSLSKAYEILDVVFNAFKALYYIKSSQIVFDDGDSTFRIVTQYRRVIGSAEEMPEE